MAGHADTDNGKTAMVRIRGRVLYLILDVLLLVCVLGSIISQCVTGLHSDGEMLSLMMTLVGLAIALVTLALLCARKTWHARTMTVWRVVAFVILVGSVILFMVEVASHSPLLHGGSGLTTVMSTGVLLSCVTSGAR